MSTDVEQETLSGKKFEMKFNVMFMLESSKNAKEEVLLMLEHERWK